MGVNTKMFVTAKKERILEVMPKVIQTINDYVRFEFNKYMKEIREDWNFIQYSIKYKKEGSNLKRFTNGVGSCYSYDFGSFHIDFSVNDENRSLFVTHTCSNDYSDVYVGDKIIFSLGCWGSSEEIMLLLADTVKEFGDVYFTKNDCETDFIKL